MHRSRPLGLLLAALSLLAAAFVLVPVTGASAQDVATGLSVSSSPDRSGAQALDGATLNVGQDVAVFLNAPGDANISWAAFFVNGRYTKLERMAPFDLKGTSSDGSAALASLEPGDYHLAVAYKVDGKVEHVTANFTVSDAAACSTIAEIATSDNDFSTLVTALSAATTAGPVDFLTVVSDPDADLTVFAPTNAAFAALPDGVLDAALADPAGLLTTVLAYHVLGTSETGADLIAAGTATTFEGNNITVTTDTGGNVFINDSQVIIADIAACNGTVHVIDNVLLPPAPGNDVLVDGAHVSLVNAEFGRYLDGDRHNVDLKTHPGNDTSWTLEAVGDGSWRLLNKAYGKYLDADARHRRYNVDLTSNPDAHGATWEIVDQEDGTYALKNVDLGRWLDGDRRNVDTSASLELDNHWTIAAG